MDIFLFNEVAEQIMARLTKTTELNLSQIRLLLYFEEHQDESLSMGSLAEGLKISLSTLSRQLKQVTTKTFITVDTSTKDSTKLIHLNDVGLTKAQQLKAEVQKLTHDLFKYWDQSELSFMNTELRLLNKRLKQA